MTGFIFRKISRAVPCMIAVVHLLSGAGCAHEPKKLGGKDDNRYYIRGGPAFGNETKRKQFNEQAEKACKGMKYTVISYSVSNNDGTVACQTPEMLAREEAAFNEKMAAMREREKESARKTGSECDAGKLDDCLKAISFYRDKDEALTRRYFNKACNNTDDLIVESCSDWAEFEDSRGNGPMKRLAMSRGCRNLNGKMCMKLFLEEKKLKRKKAAMEVFGLAFYLLKEECSSGIEASCVLAVESSKKCYPSDMRCKHMKLYVTKYVLAQKAEREAWERRQKSEAERKRNHREIVDLQRRIENRRDWQRAADRIRDSLNPPRSIRTNCRSTTNALGTRTSCVSH